MPFQPFDPRAEKEIHYRRYLPHWEQRGVTYFVTFRLADSLPQSVLETWIDERKTWLHAHGFQKPEEIFEMSRELQEEFRQRFERKLDEWLDAGHGSCLLGTPETGEIVENALRHFDG